MVRVRRIGALALLEDERRPWTAVQSAARVTLDDDKHVGVLLELFADLSDGRRIVTGGSHYGHHVSFTRRLTRRGVLAAVKDDLDHRRTARRAQRGADGPPLPLRPLAAALHRHGVDASEGDLARLPFAVELDAALRDALPRGGLRIWASG